MLELALLGLLADESLHGYELKRRLTAAVGPIVRVSFGSLYPALARLESSGAVRVVEAGQPCAQVAPMTGSLGGELAVFKARNLMRSKRARKVYELTNEGHLAFTELLSADNADERSFSLRLSFARHLSAPARLHLFETRRDQLAAHAQEMRAALNEPHRDTYATARITHDTETTEHDITWLDSLIQQEKELIS